MSGRQYLLASKFVSSPLARKGTSLPSPSSSAPSVPSGLKVEQKRDEFSVNSVYESLESSVPPGSVSPDPCPLISLGPLGPDGKNFLPSFSRRFWSFLWWKRACYRTIGHRATRHRFCCSPGFQAPGSRIPGTGLPSSVSPGTGVHSSGLPGTGLPGFGLRAS